MTEKKLWAPWRTAYISSVRRSSSKKCIFCGKQNGKSAADDRILSQGRLGFSMLNRYPYNNGHLLIAPYRHVADLSSLSDDEWLEMLQLSRDAVARLQKVMKPNGYNLGINLGRAAGAGIPGHLHLHIVPRWNGDTNFMPVVADTKVVSQSLKAAHRLLSNAHPRHGSKRR